MKCTNCGTTFNCSCKKRQASDGTACCQSCIATYENSLSSVKNVKPVNAQAPIIIKTRGSITK